MSKKYSHDVTIYDVGLVVNSASKVCLKQNKYFAQVQGQLTISGLDWCDFGVFTNVGINIERIGFNWAYWPSTLFPKLTKLYLNYGLQFLADRSQCNEQTQAPKAV